MMDATTDADQRPQHTTPTRHRGTAPIDIEALTVKYGDVLAVDALDLHVGQGEVIVLLGPSGCGKSSTLRALAGLETPTSGTIRIGDEPIYDSSAGINVSPHARGIGMVFQSYAIWPHMTVAENIGFPLKMQKKDRKDIENRVNEVLDLVGMPGLGGRGASLLSGGQMQRVALARSLVMEPRILLLDEPLSNLDAKLRATLRFELRAIQQETGVTAVYVTHDQAEALALADRIAVMRNGVIEQLGAPEEIYRAPTSNFVADFMGVENIFGCRETSADGSGTRGVTDDDRLSIVSTESRPDHTPLAMGFRSGHVQLVSSPDAGRVNCWPARLSGVQFLGTHMHFLAQLGPSTRVQGSIPEHEWQAEWVNGTDLHLQVSPRHVHVLRD